MKIILLIIVLFTTGCAIQDINQTDGIIWEKSTDGPIVAGIEKNDNNLYVADSYGSVYSFWIDSGSIRWKRTLIGEQIAAIYPDQDSSLLVFSRFSDQTTVRRYSYEEGMILFLTNIPINSKDGIYSDSDNIILHSDRQIAFYNLRDNSYSVLDLSSYTSSISSIAKGRNSYYIIDSRCNVIVMSQYWTISSVLRQYEGNAFKGYAYFLNDSLYLSTDNGIKVLSSGGTKQEFPLKTDSTPIFYDAASSSFYLNSENSMSSGKAGIGRYSVVFNSISENWFCPTFAPLTYSPIFVSSALSAAASVDNQGFLNVVNKQNGHFLLSKYIGSINIPGLKFAGDTYGKAMFVPVSSPPRIVCFALEYAFTKAR